MAVVGDAYVMIHAITSGLDKDIKDALKNVDKHGSDAGNRVGKNFNKGFQKGSKKGSPFGDFFKGSDAAAAKFSSLTKSGYALAPLLTAAAGTIGVLGTSLISLGSIIGAVTVPAITVLGSSMMSLMQAAVTVKLAFAGVGKAISAGNKAKKAGASNAKALAKAEKALERALKAQLKAETDASVELTKAKEKLKEAEDDLHDAREQAKQDLEELGFDSEDAALSEQKAAIELEKARETLARVSDLPPNSRARKEAELAFAEADLNYRRAIDKNNDLKKTEAKNAAMGNLEQQVEGQKNVVSALKSRQDAEDGLGATILNNVESMERANDAVNDAQDALDDINNNTAAVDAYNDALKDLSPEARKFVKYIVSLKNVFKDLKAAAGKDLFPKLETALRNFFRPGNIKVFKGLLQETGGVLGDIAIKFSKTVTKGENLKRLEGIWKTNNRLLGKFGDAGNNVYEALLLLLEAAKPLIDAFGDWIVNVTGAWKETLKADKATGKLASKFKIAKGIFKDLGKIFGNVFGGLGKLFEANTGPGSGGQIFLNYFKKITENFKNLKTIDGKPLKEFFAGAAKNGTKLLDLLGKILGGFINLADDPALGTFFDNLGEAVDILNTIDLGGAMVAISEFAIEIAKFVKLVTDSGSVEVFFGVLKSGLSFLNKILASGIGQALLKVAALIFPFLLGLGTIARVGKFALLVVKGNLDRVAKAFKFLLPKKVYAKIVSGLDTIKLKAMYAMDKVKASAKKAGTALVNFGKKAVASAVTGIKSIGTNAKAAGVKLIAMGKAAAGKALGGIIKFAKGSMILLTNPIFLISVAIVAIIAGLVMLYKRSEKFRKIVDKAFGAVKRALVGAFNWAKKNWPLLLAILTGPIGLLVFFVVKNFDKIKKIAGKVWDGLKSGLSRVWKGVQVVWDLILKGVKTYVKLVKAYFEFVWDVLKTGLEFVWEGIKLVWDIIVAGVKIYIEAVKAVLGFVWDVLKTALELVWTGIQFVWDLIVAGVKIYIEAVKAVLGFVWDVLKTGLELAWAGLQVVWDLIVAGVKIYIDAVKAVLGFVWDVLKTGLELVWAGIQIVWDLIIAGVKGFISVLGAVIGFVWDVLKTGLELAWAGVQIVWDLIVAGVKIFIAALKVVIEFVWNVLKTGLELAWTAIQVVWDLIVAGVKIYISVLKTVIEFVWNVLKTGLELAWTAIQVVWDTIIKGVKGFISTLKTVIEFVWNVLKTGLDTAWTAIKLVWDTIIKGVKEFIVLMTTALTAAWSGLKSGLDATWTSIKEVWTTIIDFVTGIKAKLSKAAAGMWDGIKTAFKSALNFIIDGWNSLQFKLPSFKGLKIKGVTIIPSWEGPSLGVPQIPRLARGGVIQPTAGGTLATIGEAGRPERVEPLDPDGLSKRDRAIIAELSGGGNGTTVNMVINPSAGMDERELAAIVSRQIAFQLRRGAA